MKAPLSLNELAIDRHRLRDRASGAFIADPALDVLASAMKSARGLAEQIEAANLSIMADMTNSPQANGIRLKETALKLAQRATEALDAGRARALEEVGKIDRSMAVEPPKDAVEIRAVLRTMSDTQRAKALSDDVLLAAALSAHPMLSGIDGPAQRAMLLSRYQNDRYPEQVERKARLGKALADLERGGSALIQFVAGVTAAPEIQKAEAAANRAKEAVQSAAAQ
jgi:hypothetical protein